MSVSLATVGHHFLASWPLLRRRRVQAAIVTGVIVILFSIILAPDASPTAWDWIRILLIGLASALSVLMFASAQVLPADSIDRRPRLAIAGALVAAALLLNLTFTLGTALVFSIGFTVVALIAAVDTPFRTSRTIASVLIATIPFWVWSALQAWTWGLLLLVPLAAIGVISTGHMRTAAEPPGASNTSLSPRAHRLASWLGVLGSALIAMVAGLLTDASNGVVALGAIGAIVFVALEAGSPYASASASSRVSSVAIIDAALLWVALCWIVSL